MAPWCCTASGRRSFIDGDWRRGSTLLNKALSILSGEDEDALRDYESEAKALEAYEEDLTHGTFAKHSDVMKQFEVWMKG